MTQATYRIYLLTISLLLLTLSAQGQVDSTQYAVPDGKTYSIERLEHLSTEGPYRRQLVDSTLYMLQSQDSGYLHNLGTPGSMPYSLLPEFGKTTGIRMGYDSWKAYSMDVERYPMYNAQNPTSRLFYHQGAQTWQLVRATYTQNIVPNWNVSLTFRRSNVDEPAYSNQKTRHSQFWFKTSFHSLNQRYHLEAGFALQDFLQNESGGLENDSNFTEAVGDRTGKPVLIDDNSQSKYIHNGFMVRQRFGLLGSTREVKSPLADTLTIKVYVPKIELGHKATFNTERYNFIGEATGVSYFENRWYSNTRTDDRWLLKKLDQKVYLTQSDSFLNRYLMWEVAAGLENWWYASPFLEESGAQTYLQAASASAVLGLSANAKYYLNGFNAGDYLGEVRWKLPSDSSRLRLSASGLVQRVSASLMEQRMFSNHFIWGNNFKAEDRLGLRGEVDYAGHRIEVQVLQVSNAIVWYDTGPEQSGLSQDVFHLAYKGLQRLGKFRFGYEGHFQAVNNEDLYRAPNLWGKADIYYESEAGRWLAMQKGALIGRVGMSVFYTSSWNGYGYMPGLGRYVIDRRVGEGNNIGNYPFLDVWVTARVKKFQFFMKFEHLNEGWTKPTYFTTRHYPANPRSFRLGFDWTFYN